MLENYLIVHKSVLPDYYEKVVETRRLIEEGKVSDISTAVKVTGISRSTYYKYKDYILEPSDMNDGRKAVLSMMLPIIIPFNLLKAGINALLTAFVYKRIHQLLTKLKLID